MFDIIRSNGSSDYRALQLQYQRRLSHGLQAIASYSWSNATDTVSTDTTTQPRADRFDPEINRGPADFDVRQILTSAITYTLPTPASRVIAAVAGNWSIAALVRVQSAGPANVTVGRELPTGSVAVVTGRPNRVPGVPLYLTDGNAPGGRRINVVPSSMVAGTHNGLSAPGGLDPIYQVGGPRSVQLSGRLTF